MRFLQLDLLAFGPFSSVTLDLSGGTYGLHVVYGPNEAGKSSALRSISAVLFGIPHRSVDNFVHDYKHLRIGARLQNASGQELSFVRRKGQAETLINPQHPQGAAFPDRVVDPFLGGIDAETFARVYGIDHTELLRGGEQMETFKGLAGESLFAASLGSVGLAELLHRLEDESKQLFRRRNSAIKAAKSEFVEAMKAKRAAEVSGKHWQELQRDLEQARHQRQHVIERLSELRAQLSRLGRLHSSLRWIAERRRVSEELANLGDAKVLPESYSSTARSRCQAELALQQTRVESLVAELDGECGIRAQIAETQVPTGVLEHAEIIVALQERLGAHLKAMNDLPNLQVRREELHAQASGRLRDLDMECTWDQVDRLRVPPDRRVAIQNLGSDEKRLRSLPDDLLVQRNDLEQSLQSSRTELGRMGHARDTSHLKRLRNQTQKHAAVEDEIADQRHSLADLDAEADRHLATLGLWKGTLADVAQIPLPAAETLDRFDGQFASIKEQLNHLEHMRTERSQELLEVDHQIAASERGGRPPSEHELNQRRARRDQGWRLVRDAWLGGVEDEDHIRQFSANLPLAEAFQRSVADADHVADRLRQEADRVAQRAELEARQTQLQTRLAHIDDEITRGRQSQAQLDSAWRNQWSDSGISEPLPPREMRAWLERYTNVTQLAAQIERGQRHVQQVENRHLDCCRQLADCLTEFAETPQRADSLNFLLEQAQAVIDHEDKRSRRREELQRDIARWESDRDRLITKEKQARETLDVWQRKWRDGMRWIGCPKDATAEQANQRISHLEELFTRVDQIAGLDARIHAIQEDAQAFESDVRSLVERIAPDVVELPAQDAASQLRSRLEQARKDRVRLDGLLEDEQKSQRELGEAGEQVRELQTQLNQICRLAGVASDDELPDVERRSEQVLAGRNRLCEIHEQLLDLGGGLAIDELVAQTRDQDADELAARMMALEDTIAELEAERDRVVARVRDLEKECEAMDGSSAAAEADERALGILARIHDTAGRYLRLRVAAALLRQQVDRYRAENQDPILCSASTLFARLTCDEFTGLRTEYNDEDQPVIVGVRRRNQEVVQVTGMSSGTRDQLYLSLRIGYLERQLSRLEPLPFVVDDILIQHDDDRARAALEVLAEISQQTQVIFFTHHKRLLEIAQSHLLPDHLFVHRLDGPGTRPEEPQPAISAGTKPR